MWAVRARCPYASHALTPRLLPPLQELVDKLQRQLDTAASREAAMVAEAAACAEEHGQLLAANSQLVARCAALNKQVQVRASPRAARSTAAVQGWLARRA